jgi:hypothetical protein
MSLSEIHSAYAGLPAPAKRAVQAKPPLPKTAARKTRPANTSGAGSGRPAAGKKGAGRRR